MMRRQRVAGLVLVVAGVALLAVFRLDMATAIAPALTGAVLLIVYVATRVYGFLVPGSVLTGLGIGVMVDTMVETAGFLPLGLGAGFLFVALLDRLAGGGRPGGWWPLVPGGLLVLVGAAQLLEAAGMLAVAATWWPAALIVGGLWRIVRHWRRRVS